MATIQLYSAGTPNGQKVHLFLEEAQIRYDAHPINISIGEQFHPEFLKISPNNKIPAIVDKECNTYIYNI
jgi:GST-like protein